MNFCKQNRYSIIYLLLLVCLCDAAIAIGERMELFAPSLLDAAWLVLIGLCPFLVLSIKQRPAAMIFSLSLVVLTYAGQIFYVKMLGTVFLPVDIFLLDELWKVSSAAYRLFLASLVFCFALSLTYFTYNKQFVYIAITAIVFCLGFILGRNEYCVNWLDGKNWSSISTVCKDNGLLSCIWERSSREISVDYIPSRQEVDRALDIIGANGSDNNQDVGIKRNIYYISLESAYDFSIFWDKYPEIKKLYPEKYIEWVEKWGALTAPGFVDEGSFKSCFVSLCGSHYVYPPLGFKNYPCLPRVFSSFGYKTIAFDESAPIYDLDRLYSQFGFDEVNFLNARIHGSEFYDYVLKSLKQSSQDTQKFVLIFPFTGHHGYGLVPIQDYEVPNSVTRFASALDNRDAVASSAMGIKYAVEFAEKILSRDESAVVVFRNDHLFPKTTYSIKSGSLGEDCILSETESQIPFLQRFMIVGNDISDRKYSAIVSPQDIPTLLLQISGVPYLNTPEGVLLSGLSGSFVNNGFQYYTDYENLYRQAGQSLSQVDIASLPGDTAAIHNAKRIVSRDLFYGEQYSYNSVGRAH